MGRKLEGLAMLSLARAHSADTWATEAFEVANAAIEIFVELGDKRSHAAAMLLLAELKESMGQMDSAV